MEVPSAGTSIGRAKRAHVAESTAASVAKHRRTEAAAEARKRKRAVRGKYIEVPRQQAATGLALARMMVVGAVLMDRISDGREWRDGSNKVKRPRRKEGKGDG